MYLTRVAVYPGEHAAIIDPALWQIVKAKLNDNSRHLRGHKHQKRAGLLDGLLYCSACSSRMARTYTTQKGQQYTYYRCEQRGSEDGRKCPQKPVGAGDLETALIAHLHSLVGGDLSGPVVQQALDRVVYDSVTRQVSISFRDGAQCRFQLRQVNRRGARRCYMPENTGRIPRISRLLALAIKLEGDFRDGRATQTDLAEAGQISGARMSQLLSLTNLAPKIQEELLFLPKTKAGSDAITENTSEPS